MFWNGNTRLWQSRLTKKRRIISFPNFFLSPSSFSSLSSIYTWLYQNYFFPLFALFCCPRAASSCSVFYAPLGHIGWLIPPSKNHQNAPSELGSCLECFARFFCTRTDADVDRPSILFLVLSVTTWSRRGGSISFSLAFLLWDGPDFKIRDGV